MTLATPPKLRFSCRIGIHYWTRWRMVCDRKGDLIAGAAYRECQHCGTEEWRHLPSRYQPIRRITEP